MDTYWLSIDGGEPQQITKAEWVRLEHEWDLRDEPPGPRTPAACAFRVEGHEVDGITYPELRGWVREAV